MVAERYTCGDAVEDRRLRRRRALVLTWATEVESVIPAHLQEGSLGGPVRSRWAAAPVTAESALGVAGETARKTW